MLDFRARKIHPRSNPPNAGTKHLDRIEILFAVDKATGGFSGASPFLLAVITGGFGADPFGATSEILGASVTTTLFATTSATAIPLPADLPLMLGALVVFVALRRRPGA